MVLATAVMLTGLGAGYGDPAPADRRPAPYEEPAAPHDPQARAELLELFDRGQETTWRVGFAFRRELSDGRILEGTLVELHRPPDHLTAAFGSVNGVLRGERVACAATEDGTVCDRPRPAATDDGVLEGLAVLTTGAEGAYAVTAGAPAVVAEEVARCYVLTARPGDRAVTLGDRLEYCFADDGVPLRILVDRGTSVETRRALAVDRSVTDADLDGLLAKGVAAESAP